MAMYTLFSPSLGRLGAILAIGLALWVAGTGRANADDTPENGANSPPTSGGNSPFWQGYEPAPVCPWYVSADGLAMQRLIRGLGPIATEGRYPSGTLALSQQSLDSPFQSGAGLLIGHTLDDTPLQVEVSYYWLSPSDTSAQATDPTGNLYSPFTILSGLPANPSFDFDTSIQIHEVSRLENGEVNLKCALPLPAGEPSIAFLFGVRHVGIREEFDYSSLPAPVVIVHAHTNNNLWGPQIGAVVECGDKNVWLRVEGKAALCDDEADRNLEAYAAGTDTVHPRVYHSGTAEVADISASLSWRPTSMVTAKIGYQALWCDQLALAAQNFAFDPNSLTLTGGAPEPAINTRGTLIYHGPFAGLQVNW